MTEERSLEGWAPRIGDDAKLSEVIDLAFDYRGDVTLGLTDGRDLTGYVYNRDCAVSEPYLQLVDASGASHTLRYAEVRTIRFTGRDTAAGTSYEAWLRRKRETRPA
jgi:hypothetical protein